MRMTRIPATMLVGLLAITSLSVLAGPASARPSDRDSSAALALPAVQQFYWEWSDGVDAKVRTFRESRYQVAENLPQLVVSADPARPQQYVKLQYKQDGTWKREDAGLTNGKGTVALDLNPYCKDGDWCDGTFKYRLLVNGRYTNFTITYAG
jgi:hypothetical protein